MHGAGGPRDRFQFVAEMLDDVADNGVLGKHGVKVNPLVEECAGWGLRQPCGGLCQAIDDAGFVEVVRRHFHFYAVADGKTDEPLAHLAGDMREHLVFVRQLDL